MYFAKALALAGAASALPFQDATELSTRVGNGLCMNWNYEYGAYWDFSAFDKLGRDKNGVVHKQLKDNQVFFYKLCRPFWAMTQETFAAAGGKGSISKNWAKRAETPSVAYVSNGADVKYSFAWGKVKTDGENVNEFSWESREKCRGDDHLKIKLKATCDAAATASTWTEAKQVGDDKCKWEFTYTGKDVCSIDLPIATAMTKLGPYIGLILIIFGFALCFFGTRWINHFFGALIGIVAATVLFSGLAAMVLPVNIETW